MRTRVWAVLLLASFLLACKPEIQATEQSVPTTYATHETKGAESGNFSNSEVINGVAIMPGVKRLSYISPSYLKIRPAYTCCIQATQGAVLAHMDCAEDEFKFQDARLNRVYQELIETYKTGGADHSLDVKSIVSAQKAWITFSNLDCSARSQRFGSTRDPTTEIECRMENAALRAQQFEDWKASFDSSNFDTSKSESSPSATEFQKYFNECMDKAQGITVEIMNCMGAEFEYQDIKLNSSYNALKKILPSSERKKLQDQQKQWLDSMDSDCTDDDLGGGTAQMLADKMCELERTKVRANEFQAMLSRSKTK